MRWLITAFLVSLTAVATAQNPLIVNGDFTAENWPSGVIVPGVNDSPNKLTSITGWTLLPNANIVGLGPNVASIPTPALELTGWGDSIFPSGLSQILGTTTGSLYSISFTVYDIGSSISNINFSLNGNLLGSNLNAQSGTVVGGTTKGQTYSYEFTSIGNDEISFVWPGPALSTQVSILADVEVTAVPEPSTYALLVLVAGVVGGVHVLRRRRET
jgi:hypothetical protein